MIFSVKDGAGSKLRADEWLMFLGTCDETGILGSIGSFRWRNWVSGGSPRGDGSRKGIEAVRSFESCQSFRFIPFFSFWTRLFDVVIFDFRSFSYVCWIE